MRSLSLHAHIHPEAYRGDSTGDNVRSNLVLGSNMGIGDIVLRRVPAVCGLILIFFIFSRERRCNHLRACRVLGELEVTFSVEFAEDGLVVVDGLVFKLSFIA